MLQPDASPKISASWPDGARARWVECAELISLCARLLRQVLAERTGPYGVGETHFSLLWLCRLAPETGISQSQIAGALALSPAQVSTLVEQLRSAGQLSGHRDEVDRRRQLWRLTPQGRATVETIIAELGPWVEACDARLGQAGTATLMEMLRAWRTVLNSHGACPATISERGNGVQSLVALYDPDAPQASWVSAGGAS